MNDTSNSEPVKPSPVAGNIAAGPSQPPRTTRNWADLPPAIQGAIGLGFVGLAVIAGYFGFRQEPVRCGMPSLIKEFDRLLAEFVTAANDEEKVESGKEPRYPDAGKRRIRVISSVTLGHDGDLLACSMTYDQGDPRFQDGTFEYLLGRDDKGNLIWRFNGRPPYMPVW